MLHASRGLPNEKHGASIKFHVLRSIVVATILGSSMKSFGAVQWGRDGVNLGTLGSTMSGLHYGEIPAFVAVPDGSGGVIVAYDRPQVDNPNIFDVYVSRVSSGGDLVWGPGGLAVVSDTQTQRSTGLVPDMFGGVFVVWDDWRSITGSDLYAQHLDTAGKELWSVNGKRLATGASNSYGKGAVSDGNGGLVVVWSGVDSSIYAARIDSDGNSVWGSSVPLCTVSGDKSPAKILPFSGGYVCVWRDRRAGNWDLYTQRLNAAGVPLWTTGGIAVCADVTDQYEFDATTDGISTFVVWRDYRRSAGGKYTPGRSLTSIFAQGVNASGQLLWNPSGNLLIQHGDTQDIRAIASDGLGGWFLLADEWIYVNPSGTEGRGSGRILQRVSADGTLMWQTTDLGGAFDGGLVAADGGAICGSYAGIRYVDASGNISAPDGTIIPELWLEKLLPDGVRGGGIVIARYANRRAQRFRDIFLTRLTPTLSLPVPVILSIRGFPFDPGTSTQLKRAGLPLPRKITERIISPTEMEVGFDLTETPRGKWDLELRASDGFTVTRATPFATGVNADSGLIGGPNVLLPSGPQSMTLWYRVDTPGPVLIQVMDSEGSLIKTVFENNATGTGEYVARWDVRSENGNRVASGLYLVQISLPGARVIKKVLVVR